ncbi:MAG: YjbQ family protein [Bacteroidia bacterium]|nr:MAG: YjbQ family protein [Bacteroidia bacterium]
MVLQVRFSLPRYKRGFHIITSVINDKMPLLPETGLVNIFIHHTSAALAINENADPTVRYDFESFMNKLVPENDPLYMHIFEGADDMPAHLKSSILGQSLTIPVTSGRMSLGRWQGIYLCEFRNHGGGREISITVTS